MIAEQIRPIAESLVGIAQLERRLTVPPGLQHLYSDEEWLRFRLRSAGGLARHHVLEALRSSRAAVVEHLSGTAAAADHFGHPRFKATDTGDVIAKLKSLAVEGPPQVDLGCEVDTWLIEPELWAAECQGELVARSDWKSVQLSLQPEKRPKSLCWPVCVAATIGCWLSTVIQSPCPCWKRCCALQISKVLKCR